MTEKVMIGFVKARAINTYPLNACEGCIAKSSPDLCDALPDCGSMSDGFIFILDEVAEED